MAKCKPGGGGGSRGALDEEDVLAGAIARVEVRRAAVDCDELLRLQRQGRRDLLDGLLHDERVGDGVGLPVDPSLAPFLHTF